MPALTQRRIEICRDAGETWRFAESLKSVSEDTAQEYEGRTILELVQNGHDALGNAEPGNVAFQVQRGVGQQLAEVPQELRRLSLARLPQPPTEPVLRLAAALRAAALGEEPVPGT
ncbi:hypothetical protein ACFU98_14115 [Streptomyces sp. NPDC057575]|uniref:hypothetical protein n=1 Tax=unclassified Streptomyces TaxID=2593676 RepID=UPI00368BAA44